jgi:hypothetical protein
MRIGLRSSWFITRAVLATFAIAVQALIPLVVAADIAAANATPICGSHADKHGGRQNPTTACPICAALAASAAVTAPAPPALPLPRFVFAAIQPTPHQAAPDLHLAAAYRSRAPPIA